MTKTIDEKIVVLKFDNSNFEQNTRETMSTLDKLKSKLNFKGASQGLEDIGLSAKKVDMTQLSHGVEQVQAKFSALQVVGVTALANITNSALAAGKRMISSFTIDPVKAGWGKMSQTMGYVQTLVNSTGLSTEEVQKRLDKLVWYSDETSYSFEEMASALASMTATGGQIDKLIPTIMGVANATAYAGKGANEFLIAIRNITQSYSAGYLQYRDWFSLKNQNVNSKQLTQEIINAGVALGKIKKGQVTLANFETTLSKRWATTAVMERAFSNFSGLTTEVQKAAEAEGYWIKKNGKIEWKEYNTATEAIEDFRKGAANAQKDVGKMWDGIAYKSLKAAQAAKTFGEAINATKDATSSAWSRIFQVIFGNYDHQLQIFSNLANYLYDIFVEPLNKLEAKLKLAFDFHPLQNLIDKINDSALVKSFNTVQKKIQTTSKSLKEYQKIVYKVWEGDYGNMQKRWNKLTKEGWNAKAVQELVDIGDRNGKKQRYVLTDADVLKVEKKYGLTVEETTESLGKKKLALEDITEEQLRQIANEKKNENDPDYLSEDEIQQFLMLQKSAKKYRMSIEELMDTLTKYKKEDYKETGGGARALLFNAPAKEILDENSALGKLGIEEELKVQKKLKDGTIQEYTPVVGAFTALLRAFQNVLKIIKDAWHEVFNFNAIDLYMAIKRFNEFANSLYNATKSAKGMQNLKDTLKGIFSIIKLITTITGGAFKIAFMVVKTVLKTFGYSLLDVLGAIGRIISNVVEFITENNILIDAIVFLTKVITNCIVAVYRFIWDNLHLMDVIRWVSDAIHTVTMAIKGFINGIINAKTISGKFKYIFSEIGKLFSNLWRSITTFDYATLWKNIKAFFTSIEIKVGLFITKARSKIGTAIKTFGPVIWNALKTVSVKVFNFLKEVGPKIWNWLKTAIPRAIKYVRDNAYKIPEFFINLYRKVSTFLVNIGSKIGNFLGTNFPKVWNFLKNIVNAVGNFGKKLLGNVGNIKDVGKNILSGLYNGLSSGTGKVFDVVKTVATGIINLFKSLFKIHSPSLVMKALGQYILLGLIVGLRDNQGDVFKTIGDLTTDIIDKIKFMLSFISQLVEETGNAIIRIIKGMDFGRIMVGIISIGGIKAALKIGDALSVLAKGLASFNGVTTAITNLINQVKNSVSELTGGIKWRLIGAGIKDMCDGLLKIALAITAISLLDTKKAWNAAAILGSALAAIVAAFIIINKWGGGLGNTANVNLGLMVALIVGTGIAFKMMASALKTISKIENTDMKHLILMAGLMVGFLAAITLVSKIPGSKYAALTILAMGVLFKMLASTLKTLSKIETKRLGTAIAGMIALCNKLIVLMLTMIPIAVWGKESVASFALVILALGALFYLMGKTIKMVGKLDTDKLTRGIVAITIMTGLVIGLIAALKFLSGGDAAVIAVLGKTLMQIGVMFILMAITVKLVSSISMADILKGTITIGLFFGMIALFLYMVKTLEATSEGSKAERTLIGVGMAMLGIAAALVILSMVDPKTLIAPTIVIGALLLALASVVKAAQGIKADGKAALQQLVLLLGILIGGLIVLTFIDFNKIKGPAIALIAVMGTLALLVKALDEFNKRIKAKTIAKTTAKMLLLVPLIAVVGGLVAALQLIPSSNGVVEKAAAIGILLTALSISYAIIGKIGKIDGSAILKGVAGLAAIGVICLLLVGVLAIMSSMDPAKAAVNALTLSGFLIILTQVLVVTALVGVLYAATGAVAMLGLAGLAGVIVGLYLLTGVLGIMSAMDTKKSEKNAALLCKLLATIGKVLVQVSLVGPLAIIGIAAIGGIVALMKAMLPLIVVMSLIADAIDGIGDFLDKGIDLMVRLAEGLGKIIGAFAGGIIGGVLTGIGTGLTEFMNNAQGFIEGAKKVNSKVKEGAGILVEAILKLTLASFLNAVVRFITNGGSNFGKLGTQLSDFFTNAEDFLKGVGTIGNDTLKGVKTLAEAMLKLTEAKLISGVSEFLGLGNAETFKEFGSQLGYLGKGLSDFKSKIGTFNDSDVKTVDCASQAIERLAESQGDMRKTGGVWQFLTGTQEDLGTFGSNLSGVGSAIRGFINELLAGGKKFSQNDADTVKAGADAIAKLAEAAGNIPDTRGFSLKKLFLGSPEELAEFAENFPATATALRTFIATLGEGITTMLVKNDGIGFKLEQVKDNIEISEQGLKVVEVGIKALDAMAKLANAKIDSEKLQKVNDIIPKVGTAVRNLIINLLKKDVYGPVKELTVDTTLYDDKNINVVDKMVDQFKKIVDAMANLTTDDGKLPDTEKLGKIINLLPTIGSGLRQLMNFFSSDSESSINKFLKSPDISTIKIDVLQAAVTAFGDLTSSIKTATDKNGNLPDPEKVKAFAGSLPTIGGYIRQLIQNLNPTDILGADGKALTSEDVTKMSTIVTNASDLITSVSSIGNKSYDSSKVDTFFSKMKTYATNIKEFIAEISSITTDELKIADANIKTLTNTFKNYITGIVDQLPNAFYNENGNAKSEVAKQGIAMINGFGEGLKDEGTINGVKTTIQNLVKDKFAPALFNNGDNNNNPQKNVTISQGKYFLEGFLAGLQDKDKTKAVYDEVWKIGKNVLAKFNASMGIESPSKLAKKSGEFFGEGFVIGVKQYSDKVYDVTSTLGNTASEGLTNAVSTISSLVDSEIDNSPTIRPVLDLTDISNGANSINSMFNNPHLGILSNVRSISSEMNSRNQNGRNADVVSAIGNLNKSLNGVKGNTYNINGVTYDDGSNVSNAVSDLIRAIQVERRV